MLSLHLMKLRRHNKSAIGLSNANPARGHKVTKWCQGQLVTMVTTCYSIQQGSSSTRRTPCQVQLPKNIGSLSQLYDDAFELLLMLLLLIHTLRMVLATEETAVRQQVSHRPFKRQSRLWPQRGTNVNASHRRYFHHAHFIQIVGVGKRGVY